MNTETERKPMSFDSSEMSMKGFCGTGTVVREAGENFIIIGRDAEALRLFWKHWRPDYRYDEAKYSKAICIASEIFNS